MYKENKYDIQQQELSLGTWVDLTKNWFDFIDSLIQQKAHILVAK